MTELIACLSSGKGTWNHVSKLISDKEWEKVILVTNQFGKDNFKAPKECDYVIIDSDKKYLTELIEELEQKLKEKVSGIEVAVNVISGTGKEHMALLSALLKLGIGLRFIALTPEGVDEV